MNLHAGAVHRNRLQLDPHEPFLPEVFEHPVEDSVEGFTAVMDVPDGLHRLTRYTAPHDMSGSLTLSLPCGFGSGGRPLGFQLVGRDFGEDLLLRAGHAYQQRTDWGRRHPDR